MRMGHFGNGLEGVVHPGSITVDGANDIQSNGRKKKTKIIHLITRVAGVLGASGLEMWLCSSLGAWAKSPLPLRSPGAPMKSGGCVVESINGSTREREP